MQSSSLTSNHAPRRVFDPAVALSVLIHEASSSTSKAEEAAERVHLGLRQKITYLRNTAKSSYTEKCYKDSVAMYNEAINVAMYTEAIILHTNNFTSLPKPLKNPTESDGLASMYGNRAAGLMMLGAFKAAANDCGQALKYLVEYFWYASNTKFTATAPIPPLKTPVNCLGSNSFMKSP